MASTISFGNNNSGFQAGAIHGPVHNTFHNSYATARPETPPQPSIKIPFARDGDFVERGTILEDLHKRCAAPDSWTALVGLGGVGKSQLAIEHAYRTRERSAETWVLWVYASNAVRYEQSFWDIADSVKLAGRRDPQANIFKLVHDWLRECKHRWLLVLDNVDDASFLVDSPAADPKIKPRPLREWLPHCERGSVLVTTRNREAALKLVEQRDIIEVEPMGEASAVTLLDKKLWVKDNFQHDSSDVAELAAALEYMPLAMVQAAAYIVQRAPRYSVAKYLDDYKKSERKRTSLLQYDNGQLRRDWEAKNSIIGTWQMSFEHIRQTRPSAAELLSLMSFFDRQGIPEDVLRWRHKGKETDGGDHPGPKAEAADSDGEDDASQSSTGVESEDDPFEDDVVALRNFGFVADETGGTSFAMHALVQLATRTWLAANDQLEQWREQFIKNISAAFPTGEYENWAICRQLYAHAKAAAKQQPEDGPLLLQWATLLYNVAWYVCEAGNAKAAATLAEKSMNGRKRMLGIEHEDTLDSMRMLGSAYDLSGNSEKALDLRLRMTEISTRALGPSHPNTLRMMSHLAMTYGKQGQWEAARELQIKVLEERKNNFEADRTLIAESMSNLAVTYRQQGLWKAAEKLQKEALDITTTNLGADHRVTLSIMGDLAATYSKQGQWKAAEKLQTQVMETHKSIFGPDHPRTLASMNNLASTYSDQDRWGAAENLQREALDISKTKQGAAHPDTLTTMNNLAQTWNKQGQWKKAEMLQKQVMEMRKIKLGDEHPDTLRSMNNLAVIYSRRGRLSSAEELRRHVLELRKAAFGHDHPETLGSMSDLAVTYSKQGKWKAAQELQTQVLEKRKAGLGVDHPETLRSMKNLAVTYSRQGLLTAAAELQKEALEISIAKLGADHSSTLNHMSNLATTYTKQGRWENAEKLAIEVLKTCKAKLGTEHPETLSRMTDLAWIYRNRGRWGDVEKLQAEVLETSKTKFGAEHPSTLTSMHNLAFTWRALGQDVEAIALLRQCVELGQRVLGAGHPMFLSSQSALEQWEAKEAEEACGSKEESPIEGHK